MKLRWWRRESEPRSVRKADPREFLYGGGYGMHIHWSNGTPTYDDSTGRVYGHLPRRPEVGDVLIVPMESGRDSEWIFTNVELCRDPWDMFFADVLFNGYVSDRST